MRKRKEVLSRAPNTKFWNYLRAIPYKDLSTVTGMSREVFYNWTMGTRGSPTFTSALHLSKKSNGAISPHDVLDGWLAMLELIEVREKEAKEKELKAQQLGIYGNI